MNWFIVAEQTHKAILAEMNAVTRESLSQVFPKFVVMYEYFRLLRGEAFLELRGPVSPDEQKRLYEMQDEIWKKLQMLRAQLDSGDSSTKYYVEEMKKQFDV